MLTAKLVALFSVAVGPTAISSTGPRPIVMMRLSPVALSG
jgi:hypothetical protein